MLNRNMSRITLILALACSASAFMVPAKVSKVPAKVLKLPATVRFSMMASSTKESSSTEESTKNMPKPAYPGIEMPFDTGSTSENSMGNVNLEVNKFLAEGLAEWVEILAKGTLKKDPEGFDSLQHIVTKNSNHAKKLPQGYKHFGGEDYAAQLCVILETNPFYASSLTPRAGGGFEIINYDPDGKTYSSRVMRTIGRPGPRVNVKFSVKPEGGLAIDGFDVYVSPAGDDKYYVVPDEREDDNYYASAVLYDLLFVSETLHATVHMLHYVLTNALVYASDYAEFKQLKKWADQYNAGVNAKYGQVTSTLVQPDTGIITNSDKGLGGTNEVRSIIKKNIATWGASSTATEFYDNWFESPRKDLEAAGLLTEHFKHSDLGVSCAANANAALEKKDRKLDQTNEKLVEYISESGAWPAEKNGIKTVKSLLDMMMITGVIHGATFSFTRLAANPGVYRWRDITAEKWELADMPASVVACGTTIGVQKDKYVCGSKEVPDSFTEELREKAEDIFEKLIHGHVQDEDITRGALQKVLDTYDHDVTALKKVYEEQVKERDDFNEVGFLLTDYCTDLYDGKQAP